MMYEVPAIYNTESHLVKVTQADLNDQESSCSFRSLIPCDIDVYHLCCCVMKRLNLSNATTPNDSVMLYMTLREELSRML